MFALMCCEHLTHMYVTCSYPCTYVYMTVEVSYRYRTCVYAAVVAVSFPQHVFCVCMCTCSPSSQTTGWSALFISAERGDVTTTQSLLKAGANPHLRDKVKHMYIVVAGYCIYTLSISALPNHHSLIFLSSSPLLMYM